MVEEATAESGNVLDQVSGVAEEAIAFHRALKQGTSESEVALCGAGELFDGISLPDATKDSYAVGDLVRKGTIGRAVVELEKTEADGDAEDNPAGTWLKTAANGLFVKETGGAKTLDSVARLAEDGSFAGTVDQGETQLVEAYLF